MSRLSKEGFSLIEVMTGMAVFAVLALGLMSTVMYSLRSSQLNVMKNTAYATAQGFLEQIKSLPEPVLIEAINDPTGTPLPTKSVSALQTGGILHVNDPIYLDDPSPHANGENHKEILIDIRKTGSGSSDAVVMDMWFDVDITQLTQARGYEIRIDFKYKGRGMDLIPAQTNSVRIIRTSGSSNS